MRIIFMGTPEFAVPSLLALHEAAPRLGHEVVAVYTQPARAAGRGKKPRPSPVQHAAEALGLTVCTPPRLRDRDAIEAFRQARADLAIVIAYGQLLPAEILTAPRLGCVNIHASLLPRWRGAAPIHRAIMAGDTETGVCLMQMDEGLDTGAVYSRHSLPITPEMTTGDLHDALSTLGATALLELLERIETAVAIPQPETGVTYAAKIEKAEARICWQESAESVCRTIQGLSPFPGAWSEIRGERLKILRAEVLACAAPRDALPGQIIGGDATALRVACGTGVLALTHAQRAGKRAAPIEELLRGWPLSAGGKFSDA